MKQTEITSSNSLADLAARIRVEHSACTAAMKRGLQHAIAAGEMLIEAKAQLKHGEWLPWLRDHCQIPERTASLHMRLAENRAQIEAEIGNGVADMSIRGAIALIATPKETLAGYLAHEAADYLIDDFDMAAAEDAAAERLIRKQAFKETLALLDKLKAIGDTPAHIAVYDEFGGDLLSAINECKTHLEAFFDVPFSACKPATAAIVRARDIAADMLQRLERSAA
jgi:hypothetical protein